MNKAESNRAQINLRTTIPTTREKLFEFLTSPGKVRMVLPGLIESTNVSELPLKVGSTFDYKYKMYGFVLDGKWEVLALESPSRYEARTTGGAESIWKYALEEAGDATDLSLALEYDVPESILGQVKANIVKSINEKEAKHFFENLKAVFELQV